ACGKVPAGSVCRIENKSRRWTRALAMGKNSQPDAKPLFRSHQTAPALVKHRAVSLSRRRYNNQRGFLSAFEPLCPHSGRFVTVHHRRRQLATIRFYSFVRTIRPPVFTPLRRSDGPLARGSLF